MEKRNETLFFETPRKKEFAFKKSKLLMFSEGLEVGVWTNTQPLYFYPFTWLDYLGRVGVRELYILPDVSQKLAEEEIRTLKNGKVHFEMVDERLLKIAKENGQRISVICNLEDVKLQDIPVLSNSDFVITRINTPYPEFSRLEGLPNKSLLSCVRVYVQEGCDYQKLTRQVRDRGFDFLHISKRLLPREENFSLSERERAGILKTKDFETEQFRVVVPSSLEEAFARRFTITPDLGNVFSCNFSKYRRVLKQDNIFPCYTQLILRENGVKKDNIIEAPHSCKDCACIYENDMLADIEERMTKYKNPSFALEYTENG